MNKGSYFLGIAAMLVLLLALLTGTALALLLKKRKTNN